MLAQRPERIAVSTRSQSMKTITIDSPHRRKHFDFFRQMNHPHFSVCAQLDLTPWFDETRRRGLRMTASLVYLLARAANEVPQFRQRIRGQQIVEHERVHPSFAVPTEGCDVFSFCEVPYQPRLRSFVARAEAQMEAMRTAPSFEDQAGRDDYLFMSAFPWVSFTAVTHPMSYHPHDCVPRITWGKIVAQAGRRMMPLSVQAHHALVDGVHMGRYFEAVEALVQGAAAVIVR